LINPNDIGYIIALCMEEEFAKHLTNSKISACCGMNLDFKGFSHE
jgi:hypothetical protein